MTIDVGWVALILHFVAFIGFVTMLSILYVWWKEVWGGHDE